MMRHRVIGIDSAGCADAVILFVLCENGSVFQRNVLAAEPRWIEIPSPAVEQRRLAEPAR